MLDYKSRSRPCLRGARRDPSLSPSSHTTPPTTRYHNPMLTPSPLRRQQTSAQPSVSYLSPSNSQPLRTPIKQINRTFQPSPNQVVTGAKRKSTPLTTPLRHRLLTPLSTSSKHDSPGFAFLAPLPAPRFTARTSHTNAETEVHLRKQTDTMTNLRICDLDDDSPDEFGDDSGYADDDHRLPALFLDAKKQQHQVAEVISPGGHVSKRRARSRPLSADLLGHVNNGHGRTSPSPCRHDPGYGSGDSVGFSSTQRTPSSTSSSEADSPRPRHRVNSNMRLNPSQSHAPTQRRAPLQRLESAATLFFGPSIKPASERSSRISTVNKPGQGTRLRPARPQIANRHSYAGHSSENGWPTVTTRQRSESPCLPDEDEDMFFGPGGNSSFMFSITEGTPSPRSKGRKSAGLLKKYKPRDSGVVVSDDEGGDGEGYLGVSRSGMGSSTSVSTEGEGDREALVTPGFGPGAGSGWPEAVIVNSGDEVGSGVGGYEGGDVDMFILRTLAAGAKKPEGAGGGGGKKIPGTPVKKVKMRDVGGFPGGRPWQSAVANRVGGVEFEFVGKGKVPRKSLPAAFPVLGGARERVGGGGDFGGDETDEEGEDSPSSRKERERYMGLGLGKPSVRTRWLMRRSSSGAFSSSSDNSGGIVGTPTRFKGRDWQLPPPRVPTLFQPSNNTVLVSPGRSVSGSSTSSSATLNSPTTRHLPISGPASRSPRQPVPRGRFEREFEEVDEVGSGEFGRVMKVKRRDEDGEVFAVKKSKRFEGLRHRLRLREEVDILQHLSQAAASSPDSIGGRHPNVLGYIDSWEQDEALYIRTELCELGNFAHFLWEYGRVFPRLEEARVWKVIVDLSNGLRFIHDAGIIHLDLKPANVFVTGEGRFKIGDFGMASVWPRPMHGDGTFEREGDKVYLAPEVLQGRYGKAADVFSFGMTMLETASNIVVPDQGEAWHLLRQEDFGQVDLDESPELLELIKNMMRTEARLRLDIHAVCGHPIVTRTRAAMEKIYWEAKGSGTAVFAASPLGSVSETFLEEILGRGERMDISP